MVLQAGLATLLTRLGAGTDIALGSPIAGRTDSALEELIGFFINTLVLRTDTSGNPSFLQLLERVRVTNLDAYAHQELPFERLVEALNPVRSLSHHPLFQVMLVLQNLPVSTTDLAGVKAGSMGIGSTVAKFDLTLSLGERRSSDGSALGIGGGLEYSADLFERSSVEVIAERFVRLLEAVAAQPQTPLGELNILSAQERQLVLHDWNATAQPVPPACLPALFEAQVAKTPSATALIFEEEKLTYAELNTRANQLAHLLIEHGIGPEDLVALALPRCLEMVIALLGILKAGAAYLPLDPDYPAERLAFMLSDARPKRLLAVKATASGLSASTPTLLLDDPATTKLLNQQPSANPSDQDRTTPLRPQHPAYVIYTSGSTGLLMSSKNSFRYFSVLLRRPSSRPRASMDATSVSNSVCLSRNGCSAWFTSASVLHGPRYIRSRTDGRLSLLSGMA
jgi:pristinamycin I synthase-3/4